MDDRSRGLYDKYKVERTDGRPLGGCIVLEWTDPNARVGIASFSAQIRRQGYTELANELDDRLEEWRLAGEATMKFDPTRRYDILRHTEAEKAISEAIKAVESLPGDERLSNAVNLLITARDRVANYVDRQYSTYLVCMAKESIEELEAESRLLKSLRDILCPGH